MSDLGRAISFASGLYRQRVGTVYAGYVNRDPLVLTPLPRVAGLLVGHLARLANAPGSAGYQDQAGTGRIEDSSGPQCEAACSANHFARALGRDKLHRQRAAGRRAARVQHLEGRDDVERIEAIEKDDLCMHSGPHRSRRSLWIGDCRSSSTVCGPRSRAQRLSRQAPTGNRQRGGSSTCSFLLHFLVRSRRALGWLSARDCRRATALKPRSCRRRARSLATPRSGPRDSRSASSSAGPHH
jgi:hypothetical protein